MLRHYMSEVQCGHFVALMLISLKHFGQTFVAGATSAASCSAAAFNLFINLMSKNTAKATITKLINVLMNIP